MVDVNALRAEMVRNGYTQKELAKKLEMSEKTLVSRLKRKAFGTDEAQVLIEILNIKNPAEIFFANIVS